jgi:3-oxoacyl-[acyl-carrier protein] reductase
MDLGLQGRVALVTGASKGLGFAIAKALADEGVKVAITSRDEGRVEAAAKLFGGTGFVHDSTNLEGVPILVHEVEHFLGPIDILVTNTGGPPGDPDALGFTREQWQEAYDALVLAPVTFIDAVLPSMRKRLWGRILNVGSVAVREPIPNLVLSNANRAATLATFKTIARQVARDGVTLNTLLPGRISTDRLYELYGSRETADEVAIQEIPARRLGSPEEFAAAATFLCSAQASYITGVALAVDGGMTRSI